MSASIENKKSRKGPGRPRKTPKKTPMPKNGISLTPTNNNNIIEVLYAIPIIFKRLISFFKALAAAQIQVIFRHDEIIMYAQGHHRKSRIRIRIDASKLNHYYCAKPVDIGISCRDLDLILNKVDKEYNSIILISERNSVQKNITIALSNDMHIDETHVIGLIGRYDHMEDEQAFIVEDYTLKFNLPCRYFKKTISDIKVMSNRMSITQDEIGSPLEICYRSNNKKVRSKHTAKDPVKIQLQSKLLPGESFRVDVKVEYIKPIASAQISSNIWILVDENKNFMTKSLIDNGTIEIKTLTDIIDDRPELNI